MGLWNFLKRLFALVLAYLWNRVTEGFRSDERSDIGLRADYQTGDYIRSHPTSPSYGPAFYPGFHASEMPSRQPNIYPGRYAPETMGYTREYGGDPVYSSSYPADSLRSYPVRKMWAYSGPPVYRNKAENLYEDDVLVYRDGRFSFGKKDTPYLRTRRYG